MYESKYTSTVSLAVIHIGTDRIVHGLFECVQADNTKAVEDAFKRLMECMPKDGTCELSVWYDVE